MDQNENLGIPEARLIGQKGLLSDLEFKILADTIYLGRVSGNDIVLNDTSVSSQHAKISWENGNFILSDLDSKNGISVNGKAVTKRLLRNGDRIKVGGTTFRFVYKAPARDQKVLDRPSPVEGGTNPVRKAIYAIGIFIILVIILRLIPARPPEDQQKSQTPTEVEVYVTMDSLMSKMNALVLPGIEDAPVESENHYKKGIIYFDSRQFRQAIAEYLMAKKLSGVEGKFEAALKAALEQLNKEIDYHVRLGKFHSDHLRYNDAIKEWEYALFLIEDTTLPQYARLQSAIQAVRERLQAHADKKN